MVLLEGGGTFGRWDSMGEGGSQVIVEVPLKGTMACISQLVDM